MKRLQLLKETVFDTTKSQVRKIAVGKPLHNMIILNRRVFSSIAKLTSGRAQYAKLITAGMPTA
jgi:hypothetical protein